MGRTDSCQCSRRQILISAGFKPSTACSLQVRGSGKCLPSRPRQPDFRIEGPLQSRFTWMGAMWVGVNQLKLKKSASAAIGPQRSGSPLRVRDQGIAGTAGKAPMRGKANRRKPSSRENHSWAPGTGTISQCAVADNGWLAGIIVGTHSKSACPCPFCKNPPGPRERTGKVFQCSQGSHRCPRLGKYLTVKAWPEFIGNRPISSSCKAAYGCAGKSSKLLVERGPTVP